MSPHASDCGITRSGSRISPAAIDRLFQPSNAQSAARTARLFSQMLHAGLDGIQSIGSAKVGDKTLIDAFVPAVNAFDEATASGKSFAQALTALTEAAEKGRDSTIDLVAKIGRASRLGERSLGILDAGATSCALILSEISIGVSSRLEGV